MTNALSPSRIRCPSFVALWTSVSHTEPSRKFLSFRISDPQNKRPYELASLLFVPRAAVSARKMTFFRHALFGVAHQNLGPDPILNVGSRDSAFALALGGGVDFPLVSKFAFRAGGDYLRTTLFHATQQDPRFVPGLVVRSQRRSMVS